MIDVKQKIMDRFSDLISRGEEIKNTCKRLYFLGNKKTIDPQVFEAWRTSCLSLLHSTFGSSSPHYSGFTNMKFFDHYNSTLIYLGILQGAKDDIEKGYFYHKDLMLSVNLFTSLLQKAQEMAEAGMGQKAVAIMEAVTWEILHKLAESRKLKVTSATGIGKLADSLLKAESIDKECRGSMEKLFAFLESRSPSAAGAAEWVTWLTRFLYDNLGSQIVILN